MADNKIDRFKLITLTQGGADAFVESSVSTDIVPENGEAWLITQVDVAVAVDGLIGVASDFFMGWSLSRDTKASLLGYADPDIVYVDGIAHLLTTSGSSVLGMHYVWTPPENTIFVEPTIYAQLDSTTTGVANTVNMRIHYKPVKVSEIDILRLLQNA